MHKVKCKKNTQINGVDAWEKKKETNNQAVEFSEMVINRLTNGYEVVSSCYKVRYKCRDKRNPPFAKETGVNYLSVLIAFKQDNFAGRSYLNTRERLSTDYNI